MKRQYFIIGASIIVSSNMVAQYPEMPIYENSRPDSRPPRIDIPIQPSPSAPFVSGQNEDAYVSYIQQFYQVSADVPEEDDRQKEMKIQPLTSEISIPGRSRVYDVDDFYQTRPRVASALRFGVGKSTFHLKKHSYKNVRIRRMRKIPKGKMYKQLITNAKKQSKPYKQRRKR